MLSNQPVQEQFVALGAFESASCLAHALNYQKVCCDPACIDSNQYLLCTQCLNEHPSHHKPLQLSYVFSNGLLEEVQKHRAKVEAEVFLGFESQKNEAIKQIDQIFDELTQNVLKILEGSRQTVKKQFKTDVSVLSKLQLIEKDLLLWNSSHILSDNDKKNHAKQFASKAGEFNVLRNVEINITTEDSIKTLVGTTQAKLDSLLCIIKKFINQEQLIEPSNVSKYIASLDLLEKPHPSTISNKDIQKLHEIKVFETNHNKSKWICGLLLLEDGMFITWSTDKTIRVWDFDKKTPEIVLTDHTDMVWSLIKLQGGRFASASDDKTIKLWNLEQFTCERTLSGYSQGVRSLLELPNSILVGGSSADIRMWNLKEQDPEKACLRVFPNSGYCFIIIQLNKEEIACGNGGYIDIYRVFESDVPVKKVNAHFGDVRDLLLDKEGKIVFSCGKDFMMRMWNIEDWSCVRGFHGNSNLYKIMWLQESIIAAGYYDAEIKFWNVENGECVRTLKTEKQPREYGLVTGMDGTLISFGTGATITFWSD